MTTQEIRILKYFSKHSDLQPLPKWANLSAIRSLNSRGYLTLNILQTDAYITDEGLAALSDDQDHRNDRRWTRGLAIAAIIISLFTLLFELKDQGFFHNMLSHFKSSQVSAQSSPD